MSGDVRTATHRAVSTALARCSDDELGDLLAAARPAGSGIGGTSALLDVDGTPVFVKRVPLTDLERRPENVRSTANLFDLPLFAHYGVGLIGAPGFGAWRELAVHETTTDWVVAGEHDAFPLLHHWRVLPHPGQPLPAELADVDRAVAYWGGGAPFRRRIEALRDSSASIALFLEYVPQTLHDWLDARVRAGDEAAVSACALVEKNLRAGVAFMNARGLLHFDAHFRNILTDGDRLFFADYGLAVSSGFELSRDEADFFARHQAYDRCYSLAHLVIWLATAVYGYRGEERDASVRAWARGSRPPGVPPRIADLLSRHAPLAVVMTEFSRRFRLESRQAPYPAAEIDRVEAADGLSAV